MISKYLGEIKVKSIKVIDEARREDLLGTLPPLCRVSLGFLVGEPMDTRECQIQGNRQHTYLTVVTFEGADYEIDSLTEREWEELQINVDLNHYGLTDVKTTGGLVLKVNVKGSVIYFRREFLGASYRVSTILEFEEGLILVVGSPEYNLSKETVEAIKEEIVRSRP
jgi:hypothetical protein